MSCASSAESPRPNRALEALKADILSGQFGAPGERFLTTRELAEIRRVSPVTAQRLLVALRHERFIALHGKRHYLSHGRIPRDSALGQLTKNSKRLLGLHVTTIDTPFFSALTRAAQNSAAVQGYGLLTAESGYNPEREREILNTFEDIGVAGVLSCPGLDAETGALYNRYRLSHVFLGRKPTGACGEAVLADNACGAARVAAHFIREGYRSFGYVGLALNKEQDTRLKAFSEALTEAGFELPEGQILRVDARIEESPDALWDEYLRRLPRPAAVFCFHDLLAVRLLQACRRAALNVPRTLAVAGFDNLPVTALTDPPLTTVSYDVEAMAEAAVRLLIAQIETDTSCEAVYPLEPVLIIRQSSAATPAVHFRETPGHDLFYSLP